MIRCQRTLILVIDNEVVRDNVTGVFSRTPWLLDVMAVKAAVVVVVAVVVVRVVVVSVVVALVVVVVWLWWRRFSRRKRAHASFVR